MRDVLTARLEKKAVLSERAQCYHLEFSIPGAGSFHFEPGQFISCVAEDSRGKQQTRAYSLASAPRANRFDLCVNRVEGGFFSNRLCDLRDGETLAFHGPHGMFTLQQPLTESLLLAADTGIAPMRGFVQWLFAPGTPHRSSGNDVWLVYSTQRETELYYREELERIAAAHSNFHYIPTLSEGGNHWTGERGALEDYVRVIRVAGDTPAAADAALEFFSYAYICGLNGPVRACRERLRSLGWQRKQIVSERYD